MPDPAQFRDSTQIVLPRGVLESVVVDVEERFTVTVTSAGEDGEFCRIVGSPVEIKDASEFLTRHGVPIA